MSNVVYAYEINPRPAGGWRLRLLEDGVEVGGGVFAADEYEDAEAVALEWLESRAK